MDRDETLPLSADGKRLGPQRRIAGRYCLERLIGMGGHGKVWGARDEVSGERVAVKLLRRFDLDEGPWTRREIATLRMLRIPGVVRLLDEGIDAGETFIVMELVEGRPFPGSSTPADWSVLEPLTIALLETLGRLHAEGVVHRDLKPDNILVDAAGHPTVLDFGIATTTFVSDRLTSEGDKVGTPAYLAPEQVRGDRPTASSDLYALGVILYEALAGRLPHDASNLQGLLLARLTVTPPLLSSLAPAVPAYAAETIDWLLRREPEDRPASAADVLQSLRRQPAGRGDLPCLGREALLDRIATTLGEGQAFRLGGGPGMGKTRIAQEVTEILRARGRRVEWIVPGEGPYSALVPVLGSLEAWRSTPVDEVRRNIRKRLREVTSQGTILVVDDGDRLDRSSARLLAAEAKRAPVLLIASSRLQGRRGADAVLQPLAAHDLEHGLFDGSNRLFHIREDAARELLRRTNGVPARMEIEMRTWARAGLARRLPDGRFALDRAAVERLTTDLVPVATEVLRPRRARRLTDQHDELLAWIELADGAASEGVLAELTGRPAWEIDSDLDELVDTGACGRVSRERLVALEGSRLLDLWSSTDRCEAHARLARVMPLGAPGRLRHLVLARTDEQLDVVRESLRLANRWAAEGVLGRASVALEEGLAVARRVVPLPHAEILELLALWVAVALQEGSTRAIDRVLYELSRLSDLPGVDGMTALARAALAVRASSTGGADLAEAVPPLEDRRLDRLRQSTRVLAARRRDLAEEERIVEEARAWAALHPDDRHLAASAAGWEGKLRYRQGRGHESLHAHKQSAQGTEWPVERIAANLHAAASALYAFELHEARELATVARSEAASCRHSYLEGRAEYFIRCARYRLEEPLTPDLELVSLVSTVASDLEALCALQEAAVAYRQSDHALAGSLAARASWIWRGGGEPPAWILAESLATACGAGTDGGSVEDLRARILAAPPSSMLAQSAALLTATGARVVDRAHADALFASVPSERWATRLAVLSMNEVRAVLAPD